MTKRLQKSSNTITKKCQMTVRLRHIARLRCPNRNFSSRIFSKGDSEAVSFGFQGAEKTITGDEFEKTNVSVAEA
jgi:hypothetical protein